VVFISLMTAVLMNVMITRPIIHEMRDNFQQRSRELVYHFQNNKEHFTSTRKLFLDTVHRQLKSLIVLDQALHSVPGSLDKKGGRRCHLLCSKR
jgi:hypothetical protein